mmetsp:Transcript_97428/g.303843  ORF Transcript_97428/g.303843 Transcript_97428/m.303843 type:complete len:205 (+) Transcript_97428:79-693(+)
MSTRHGRATAGHLRGPVLGRASTRPNASRGEGPPRKHSRTTKWRHPPAGRAPAGLRAAAGLRLEGRVAAPLPVARGLHHLVEPHLLAAPAGPLLGPSAAEGALVLHYVHEAPVQNLRLEQRDHAEPPPRPQQPVDALQGPLRPEAALAVYQHVEGGLGHHGVEALLPAQALRVQPRGVAPDVAHVRPAASARHDLHGGRAQVQT